MSLNQPITNFEHLNVWIIGASSGIGKACVSWFANQGSNLILSARRLENLEELKSSIQLKSQSQHIHSIALDVTSTEQIGQALSQVMTIWNKIDLILFVSGIYTPVRADDFDMEVTSKMIDTNLMGPMRVVSAAMPQFLQQG
jgi:NADP-dependent 3-hydroxy acid dehydrogenase YdfG